MTLSAFIVERNWTVDDALSELSALGSLPLARRFPSAWCALELSVLDLLGRSLGLPLWRLFSRNLEPVELTYSAVVPMLEESALAGILNRIKEMEMRFVKVKVGDSLAGESRLKRVREILGDLVDIRVDANGAFTGKEAVEFLDRTGGCHISAIEQPVPKEDMDGLKMVTGTARIPVIVDESICSIDDAKALAAHNACNGFNIRLSKCGGLIKAMELIDFARSNKIFCQIGCHVGETAVLAAAGRHLAALMPDHVYLEGSYSSILLSEDLSRIPVSFKREGKAHILDGPGLGIDVSDDSLNRLGEKIHSENVM